MHRDIYICHYQTQICTNIISYIDVGPLHHVCIVCACVCAYERDRERDTYVKQKKRVVDPTRKVVAADTGTYRLGRNGRGGAEAGPPTPPPTPPPLKPGIRDRERGEEDREREVDIYCLPTVKGALQVKMANTVFVWEEGP